MRLASVLAACYAILFPTAVFGHLPTTVDGWNRLVAVAHAYRNGSRTLSSGRASITMTAMLKVSGIRNGVVTCVLRNSPMPR